MYSKKSGNWYAVPLKAPKKYKYIVEMQTDVVYRRMAETESVTRRRELTPEDLRRISGTLAPTSPPPTAELVRRHRSRMSKRLRSTQAPSQFLQNNKSG